MNKGRCLQGEYDSTKSRTKYNFDSSPAFPGQYVQVTSEGDSRQEVREEDINGACKNQLIEDSPVRCIPTAEIHDILPN